LVSNEYIKSYDQSDPYKWSRFVGDLMADCWFVVPAIEQALVYSENVMDAEHTPSELCLTTD